MKETKLTVIYGPMFSGKTSEIIKLYNDKKETAQVFKPAIDQRYTDKSQVVSHDNDSIEATSFDHERPSEIIGKIEYGTIDTVIIDEVQFCSDEIMRVIQFLLKRSLSVIVAGLDLDSDRNVFGNTLLLTEYADVVIKKEAVCSSCGLPAQYTKSLVEKEGQISVGAADKYTSVCKNCL